MVFYIFYIFKNVVQIVRKDVVEMGLADYNELLKKASLKTEELSSNTIFTLRSLFVGTFWNDLKKGVRLELGRRFKQAVIANTIPHVIYIGKNDSNASLYRKQ